MGLSLLLCEGSAGSADAAATSGPASGGGLTRVEFHGQKLASDYNLVLYAPDTAAGQAAVHAADAEIDRLELVFSDYRPDSEISRLSLATADGPMKSPVPVSDDLYQVLNLALQLSEQTDGALDVTVGPLVQLWKRSGRQGVLPSADRLAETKKSVGYHHIRVDEQGIHPDGRHTVRLDAAKMRLDFGAIATGYISDQVLKVLAEKGIHRALCDLSGDLAVGDAPPGRKGWTVAIQSLTKPDEQVETLEVSRCGVSTSGDTYRFVEINGTRYSHIVDVRTGLGLTHRIGVSVVAPDGIRADVLATAVSVLGKDKGIDLLKRLAAADAYRGVGARITTVDGGATKVEETEGYRAVPHVK